jgi:tetratricopeptide (TPR) repeat protein
MLNEPATDRLFGNRLFLVPTLVEDFTGREEESQEVVERLCGEDGTIRPTALCGMGGVGKTTLARRVAHLVACQFPDAFPDALIELNLRGSTESPLSPSSAMAAIIHAFDPNEKLPDDDATALSDRYRTVLNRYRTVLNLNRAIILLDDARDEGQVEDLIAERSSVGFILTSRNVLSLDCVHVIRLASLPSLEAFQLLRRIVPKKDRIDDELAKVAELCGCLPLALRVAGDFLRLNEDWSVRMYINALQNENLRWARLEGGTRNVKRVLDFSAAQLVHQSPELARLWQMLSVFPDYFDTSAATTVWDLKKTEKDTETTEEELSKLRARSLVEYDLHHQRYRLHDLMRPIARTVFECVEEHPLKTDSETRLAGAERRFAEHYCRVLKAANDRYLQGHNNTREGLTLFDMEARNIRHGRAWASQYRSANKDAIRLCRDYAIAAPQICALRLSAQDRVTWFDEAIGACREIGDRLGEGKTLGNLGNAWADLGDAKKAIEFHEQYLTIAREIGNRREEEAALGNLGNAWAARGDAKMALTFRQQRLDIVRELEDRRGESYTLGSLGNVWADLGDAKKAIEFHEQHLDIAREIGDWRGQGNALGNLGDVCATLGELEKAISFYQQHLLIAHEIGDRRGESYTRSRLGKAWADLGDAKKAIDFHEQHLDIAREIGDQRGEAIANWNKACVLAEFGKIRAAIPYAEQSLAFYVSIEHPDVEERRRTLAVWRAAGWQPDAELNKVETIRASVAAEQAIATPLDQRVLAPVEPDRRGGRSHPDTLTDEQILARFEALDPKVYLRPLQVFWCIGHLERDAFQAAGRALGYGQLSEELRILNPLVNLIPLSKSVGYIVKTCLPKIVDLFKDTPFQSAACPEKKDMLVLRDEDWQGDRLHGRWTPYARTVWSYIDRLFAIREELRPKITSPRGGTSKRKRKS